MKLPKNMLLLMVALFTFQMLQAQINFGIKAGISPGFNTQNADLYVNRLDPENEFAFNTVRVNNSIQVGAFMQKELNEMFFLEFALLYNQSSVEYQAEYLYPSITRSSKTQYFTETQRRLTLPAAIGVHLGNVDIKSGLLAHFAVSQDSNLDQIAGYRALDRQMSLGAHTSLTINVHNVAIELGCQIDFNNYGESHSVNGQSLSLMNAPTRLVASLAYKF